METYILLYGDKKMEDNIIFKNMFKNNMQINLGWTDYDYTHNFKIIEEQINSGIEQLIFAGFEIGWDKLIKDIKDKYKKIKIKVICNTQDSLLYYDYERTNFFNMLDLSRQNIIDDIAFLRKGQYETYKTIGYKCSFLRENYVMDTTLKDGNVKKQKNENIELGIYPLNYTWDKNIFNQLCIPKFIENCNLNFNNIDSRMEEFLNTMEIQNFATKIESIDEKNIIKEIIKNDVLVATSFTEYVHPVFLMSMELGIPCLTGNNSNFFAEDDKLKDYVVSSAEDNAIINAKMVNNLLKNRELVNNLYLSWKEQYNKKANESFEQFLNK